jgi:hypothetical protein
MPAHPIARRGFGEIAAGHVLPRSETRTGASAGVLRRRVARDMDGTLMLFVARLAAGRVDGSKRLRRVSLGAVSVYAAARRASVFSRMTFSFAMKSATI